MFQITEEGFSMNLGAVILKSVKPQSQFVVRLEEYLRRWMNLANVTEDYDGLKDQQRAVHAGF